MKTVNTLKNHDTCSHLRAGLCIAGSHACEPRSRQFDFGSCVAVRLPLILPAIPLQITRRVACTMPPLQAGARLCSWLQLPAGTCAAGCSCRLGWPFCAVQGVLCSGAAEVPCAHATARDNATQQPTLSLAFLTCSSHSTTRFWHCYRPTYLLFFLDCSSRCTTRSWPRSGTRSTPWVGTLLHHFVAGCALIVGCVASPKQSLPFVNDLGGHDARCCPKEATVPLCHLQQNPKHPTTKQAIIRVLSCLAVRNRLERKSMNNVLIRLRQACNHPVGISNPIRRMHACTVLCMHFMCGCCWYTRGRLLCPAWPPA